VDGQGRDNRCGSVLHNVPPTASVVRWFPAAAPARAHTTAAEQVELARHRLLSNHHPIAGAPARPAQCPLDACRKLAAAPGGSAAEQGFEDAPRQVRQLAWL
jgi:hypothetical protein